MVQYRLDSIRSLKAAAQPHDVPPGKLRQSVFHDGVQGVPALLDQVIRTHQRVRRPGMLGVIPPNGNGTGHAFSADNHGLRNVQKVHTLCFGSPTQ